MLNFQEQEPQEEEPKYPGEGLNEEERADLLERLLRENPLHREPGDPDFGDKFDPVE